MSLPVTQQDFVDLYNAWKSGVLTVTFSGPPARTVTYQSLEAMSAILGRMDRQLSSAPVTRHVSYRSGFGKSDI